MGFISRHSRLRGNKDLDSCPVFQRVKLKTSGMTRCYSHNRTRLLAVTTISGLTRPPERACPGLQSENPDMREKMLAC